MMRGATIAIVSILMLGGATAAVAEPTADQQAAIKANCRSDFMANCMGVPRGGKEALQCLQKNLASLSAGCQQAIKAIAAAAKPAAPAVAKPAAPAAAPAATPAPVATPAPAVTPPVDATAPATTPPPASATAPAPAPKASSTAPTLQPAPPKKAVTAPPAAAAPPPAAAAPAPVIVVAPRQVFALVRTACRADYRAHCSNVDIGGGRVVQCLQANAAALSPTCREGLAALGR